MNTQLLEANFKENNWDELKNLVLKSGYSDEEATGIIDDFKKRHYAKKQSSGTLCMIIGSVIGFVATVFSILNPFPDLLWLFLYVLTPIAVLIAMAGLYQLCED